MKKMFLAILFLTFFVAASCGDKKGVASGVGESCVKKSDCEKGLDCIDSKCVEVSDASDNDDLGNTTGEGDAGDAGNDNDSGNSGNTANSGDDGNTANSGDDGNTANSGDDGNTANSGDDGNTGDTSDPCAKCDSENRVCVEKDDGWVCEKCKDDFYPDEDGVCIVKKELGHDCDFAEHGGKECLSGKCVDGVCCDSDCGGLCESCNVNDHLKGKCSPHFAGTDPDNDCDEEFAESCGNNGFCDGAGKCQKYSKTTQCKAPECSGDSSIEAAFCDGEGNCDNANLNSSDCSPYTCSTETGLCAGGSCENDSECVDGYFCEDNICKAKLADGGICTQDKQCESGKCILDNFSEGGKSYCVPTDKQYCAKEGDWFDAGMTFCAPAGSVQFRKCNSTNLWGGALNCSNSENRGCVPSKFTTLSGYYAPDSCKDEASGHKCQVATSCNPCATIFKKAGATAIISIYAFDESAKVCRSSCRDSSGNYIHDWCGNMETSPNYSHYCAALPAGYTPGGKGYCESRKNSGANCTYHHECISNRCEGKQKKYCD
ncbi:MAG: hypothetical protein ACOX2F_04120 [bacterium]